VDINTAICVVCIPGSEAVVAVEESNWNVSVLCILSSSMIQVMYSVQELEPDMSGT
jgi:hypothetical protein